MSRPAQSQGDATRKDGVMEPRIARAMWQQLETLHAVTYFAPECRAAFADAGLRGFWMGYFAGRAAPFGPVGPGVVAATFFNFHPDMVRRAIPDAWSFASPAEILSARAESATAAIRRVVPGAGDAARALLPVLRRVIAHGSGAGRPLFAANRELAPPDDEIAELWQGATTMREHRGDGHVAVLTEAGLDGCEVHVLFAATTGIDGELLRANRGWSPADWQDATNRLHERGLLHGDGSATPAGRAGHDEIEQRTDELAIQPFRVLSADEVDRLLRQARLLAAPIATAGDIPFPNPMGLPPPDRA
jgi:hypothetical protein